MREFVNDLLLRGSGVDAEQHETRPDRWDATTETYAHFPVTKAQRALSAVTVVAVITLLIAAVGHLLHRIVAASADQNLRWSVVDAPYLLGMIALAAFLIVHAALQEEAMLPRTIISLTCVFAVPAALLLYLILIVRSIPPPMAWTNVAIASQLVVGMIPFALAFAAGMIMWRNDVESPAYRVRAVALAVAITTLVVFVAAAVPWLVYAIEVGQA